MSLLVFQQNDTWWTRAEIPHWWQAPFHGGSSGSITISGFKTTKCWEPPLVSDYDLGREPTTNSTHMWHPERPHHYSTFAPDLSSLSLLSSSNLFIYLFISPQDNNESQVLLRREPCGLTLISISPTISNHQLVVFSLSLFFSNEGKDVNKPEEHLLQWWLHCESLDLLYQQTSLAYKTKSNVLFGTWTWTTWLYPFVVCCNFIRG